MTIVLQSIRRYLSLPHFEEAEKMRVAHLLHPILLLALGGTFIGALAAALLTPRTGEVSPGLFIALLMGLLVLLLLRLLQRGWVRRVSLVLLTFQLAAITFGVLRQGTLTSAVTAGYSIVIVVAGLLLGRRGTLLFTALTLLVTGALFSAEQRGLLPSDVTPLAPGGSWVVYLTIFLTLGWLLHRSALSLDEALAQARRNERARQISAQALATSAEVSRRLSMLLDQDQLLEEVVEQVQQAFDYYHVQIYLLDGQGHLSLVKGAGAIGEALLEQVHTLQVGQGLVGQAAAANQVVRVTDVSQAADWIPNPLLPATRSEIAVPIALGQQVLGVLDVQDDEVGGLEEQDAYLLRAIADQVAIALQNTQLYQQAQRQADLEARVNAISQKIQRTTTLERALEITVRELGDTLGEPVRAWVKVEHDDPSTERGPRS